ncbi:AAA family ATPase [Plantactinospora sp. WMMB782]|uniref:AAA family ATPase n=1 Tax=Plantactinospora sp. WMMB782 TaxID=3404121 RepID=UPI003B955069
MELIGRAAETGRIAALIDAAREGRGGALVLRGEAGIGKSALLDHACATADGFQVVEASGSQFETQLPFAALHQVCAPMLGRLPDIPAGYAAALRVAFGQVDGVPDVFRAGLAALELFALAGRPLLCTVDDAQWMDAASVTAMALLARRITVEPVALLIAVREPGLPGEFAELPGLAVAGLADEHARTLLSTHGRTLDEQVRDRLVAEARGNPLALRELPAAGGFAPPESVPSRIERGFRARLIGLPAAARLLLTVASADPTGSPDLLWTAAASLGVPPDAGAAAAGTGLVTFATRIRFCHPLARSAVYRAAPPGQRRSAHRALAEATDPVADPDRRAWHRAQAAAGPDDAVADELERSASRARARGGVVAAAAFIERAAALSSGVRQRTDRTLAAVDAHIDAGHTDDAAALLSTVDAAGLDVRAAARADLLRGRIAFLRHHDGDGPAHMLRAASRLSAVDPLAARECLLDALEMSLVVGRATGMMDKVLAASARASTTGCTPDVLDALATLATDGHRAAVPLLREFLDGDGDPLWTARPALAVMIASELLDERAYTAIIEWLVKTGREVGSPLMLRLALAQTASAAALRGDLAQATAAIAEEEAIADAIGGPPMLYPRLHVAALRGRRDETLFTGAAATAEAIGAGQLVANVHWAAAVLHNGLTEYATAYGAARRAVDLGDLFLAGVSMPELVEAATRLGRHDEAAAVLASFEERTRASGTALGLGMAAYARGLVTGMEDDYRSAVELLSDSQLLPYRARSHLLYGEWLRRAGRRQDSRHHLRTAHDLFSAHGLAAFADRAAAELRATGEVARRHSASPLDGLTMQETSVARLVATGATSAEVATRLFISPRTVDAHLRSIFRKLGISSRRQLRGLVT